MSRGLLSPNAHTVDQPAAPMQALCHAAALRLLDSPMPKPPKLRLKKKMRIEKELLGFFGSAKKSSSLPITTNFPPIEGTSGSDVAMKSSSVPSKCCFSQRKFVRVDSLLLVEKENTQRPGSPLPPTIVVQTKVQSHEISLKRKFELINGAQAMQGPSPQRIKIRRVQNGQISSMPQKASLVYQF